MFYLMMLRVFALPVLFLFMSGAAVLLCWFIPGQFENNDIFAPLAKIVADKAWDVSGWLLLAAAVCSVLPGWRVWQWFHGKGEMCHVCGCMVIHRDGRWGPYWHCLACGNNRRDR